MIILNGQITFPTSTQKKIAKEIGIICRTRKFFSKSALIIYVMHLYFRTLFIVSRYGVMRLVLIPNHSLKLQNKIIRMITNSHFLASSDWGLVSFILARNYIFN